LHIQWCKFGGGIGLHIGDISCTILHKQALESSAATQNNSVQNGPRTSMRRTIVAHFFDRERGIVDSMLKRILWGVLAAIAVVAAVLAWNTWRLSSRQIAVKPIVPLALERDAVAARLAGALKFRTVSDAASGDTNAAEFLAMQAYLEQAFPRLHAALKREMVGHSMLFTWQGSDPKARPVMWLAHQDVVPVAPGTEANWQHRRSTAW
jgi:hypothetical protein